MPTTRVRVAGGGNTYVMMGVGDGIKLGFNSAFDDRPGRPVAQPVEIQPIGDKYPIEIATAYAMGAGTITVTVYATWGYDGWVSAFLSYDTGRNTASDTQSPWHDYHSDGSGRNGTPVDLVEVLDAQRQLANFITVKKYELGRDGKVKRIKNYENCVITDIGAQETIRNNTMVIEQTITLMYTRVRVTDA